MEADGCLGPTSPPHTSASWEGKELPKDIFQSPATTKLLDGPRPPPLSPPSIITTINCKRCLFPPVLFLSRQEASGFQMEDTCTVVLNTRRRLLTHTHTHSLLLSGPSCLLSAIAPLLFAFLTPLHAANFIFRCIFSGSCLDACGSQSCDLPPPPQFP